MSDNDYKPPYVLTERIVDLVERIAMDIGGYYCPDPALAAKAMRPSATFNSALSAL